MELLRITEEGELQLPEGRSLKESLDQLTKETPEWAGMWRYIARKEGITLENDDG